MKRKLCNVYDSFHCNYDETLGIKPSPNFVENKLKNEINKSLVLENIKNEINFFNNTDFIYNKCFDKYVKIIRLNFETSIKH